VNEFFSARTGPAQILSVLPRVLASWIPSLLHSSPYRLESVLFADDLDASAPYRIEVLLQWSALLEPDRKQDSTTGVSTLSCAAAQHIFLKRFSLFRAESVIPLPYRALAVPSVPYQVIKDLSILKCHES